ncbi:MAG: hypothetical protein ABWZ15_15710, partial [Acidimicrobiia bacterium]
MTFRRVDLLALAVPRDNDAMEALNAVRPERRIDPPAPRTENAVHASRQLGDRPHTLPRDHRGLTSETMEDAELWVHRERRC